MIVYMISQKIKGHNLKYPYLLVSSDIYFFVTAIINSRLSGVHSHWALSERQWSPKIVLDCLCT